MYEVSRKVDLPNLHAFVEQSHSSDSEQFNLAPVQIFVNLDKGEDTRCQCMTRGNGS